MTTNSRAFLIRVALTAGALLLLAAGSPPAARAAGETVILGGPLRYQVVASKPRLNRRATGPVTRFAWTEVP